ncbi:CASP-like protein 1F2 [Chenopodium quinoa]|uniref:CASP-like protein 1F2 n=1 Tax=Chenopodium quinoa TaxID=63459 RepID=UPI000B784136|nr:CASP-like protein 1F2 [Chenopodium quinoa]
MGLNDGLHANESNPPANTSCKILCVTQILLRSLAAMSAIASIFVMVNSGQSTEVFGIIIQAKYSYSSAFKFLLGTNIAICAYLVLSIFTICVFFALKTNWKAYFSLFLQDLIVTVLMISGCAAATAIGYVGKYGQDQTGWSKICDNATIFCNYIAISIGLSYFTFICLFVLTIMAFKRAQFKS